MTRREDGDRCWKCRWWNAGEVDMDTAPRRPTSGECRASNPTPSADLLPIWPVVGENEWCGKYEENPDA